MSKISEYVNNVFYAFPQDSTVLRLKADMMDNMEEKYSVLCSQGKSENEALGQVIAEFGSIEELAASLGISPSQNVPAAYEPLQDPQLMESFENFMDLRTKIMILSIVGILVGVALMFFLIFLKVDAVFAVSILLLFVAAAVGGFVWIGLTEERFNRALGIKDVDTMEKIGQDSPYSGLIMAIATAAFFLWGFNGSWHISWIVFPVAGALCGVFNSQYRQGRKF